MKHRRYIEVWKKLKYFSIVIVMTTNESTTDTHTEEK
jgi:hypothetical protein